MSFHTILCKYVIHPLLFFIKWFSLHYRGDPKWLPKTEERTSLNAYSPSPQHTCTYFTNANFQLMHYISTICKPDSHPLMKMREICVSNHHGFKTSIQRDSGPGFSLPWKNQKVKPALTTREKQLLPFSKLIYFLVILTMKCDRVKTTFSTGNNGYWRGDGCSNDEWCQFTMTSWIPKH